VKFLSLSRLVLTGVAAAALLLGGPTAGAVATDSQVTQQAVTRAQLVKRAKQLQFSYSLAHFIKVKKTKKSAVDKKFDWHDNGCSSPFGALTAHWEAVFDRSCKRHDFGYRNFGHGLALGSNDTTKRQIDARLLSDMRHQCSSYSGSLFSCYAAAQGFYEAVAHTGAAQTAFYAGACPANRFCLFDDSGYKDRRIALSKSENDLNDINFGDKTSSVKNRQKVAWVIYDDHDYHDRSLCIPAGVNVSSLSSYGFNDKTSSAKRLSTARCP
jgi:hypothetical protein